MEVTSKSTSLLECRPCSVYQSESSFKLERPRARSNPPARYSEALNALRIERGVGGTFNHDLKSIDTSARTATFKSPDGKVETKEYTLLHVVPPQGPHDFVKNSPLADAAGWVDVDQGTLQHKKYENVFSLYAAMSPCFPLCVGDS